MIHYIPAFFVLIIHIILGASEHAEWPSDRNDELVQNNNDIPYLNWLIPLLVLILLILFVAIPTVGGIICILYGLWVVADNIQRWVKSNAECNALIASKNDKINNSFRVIFVIFVTIASVLLSYGYGSGRGLLASYVPFAPIVILILFMLVAWLASLGSGANDPESIIIEYVKAGETTGPMTYWRITFAIMILVVCTLSSITGINGGIFLVIFMLILPILIRIIFSHECLYKKVGDGTEAGEDFQEWLACKFDKYGGLRTYLTIIWLCICCVIIKRVPLPPIVKAVLVTTLFFINVGVSAAVSVV